MIKSIAQLIGHTTDYLIRWLYIRYYKINPRLRKELKVLLGNTKERFSKINEVRTNNIVATFWSNAGTVVSLALAILSFIFSTLYAIEFPFANILVVLIAFCSSLIITLLITPVLLRKIALSLPAESYAKISLSDIGQSQILTFVALKMWELCDDFDHEVRIPERIKNCVDLTNDEFKSSAFSDISLEDRRELFLNLQQTIKKYKSEYYKKLSNCRELKAETTKRLGILPREFSHHILKFSTSIFEIRVNRFQSNVESILYALNSETWGEDHFTKLIGGNVKEMMRIKKDITNRRKRALAQIIAYDGIHDNLIGLSSATSTSQSLNIFTRGLSEIAKNMADKGAKDYKYNFLEFKSLLHRSKAHYGFDLLVTLENFYNVNYPKSSQSNAEPFVPDILQNIFNCDWKESIKLEVNALSALKKMRENIIKTYFEVADTIVNNFERQIEPLIKNCNGNVYFVIFGYSRMIRNTLQEKANFIKSNNIKTFVMKEDDELMLDTRMLRFELNDQKPNKHIRTTFTSSDHFFYSLVQKNDLIIMLAGAEAFDEKNKVLIHTNNYQLRVQKLIGQLQDDPNRQNPEVFIIAEGYKIYNQFPNNGIFTSEFYSDHYDKMDYYNFKDLKLDPYLITENSKLRDKGIVKVDDHFSKNKSIENLESEQ